MPPIRLGLVLWVLAATLAGCSNKVPDTGDIEAELTRRVAAESNGCMRLISVEKTDGFESPRLNSTYMVTFAAEVEFLKDCKWRSPMFEEGHHSSFATTVTDSQAREQSGFWGEFFNMSQNPGATIIEGTRIRVTGELGFLTTEKGFRPYEDLLSMRQVERIAGEIERQAIAAQEEAETRIATARATELEALQSLKAALDRKRAQLTSGSTFEQKQDVDTQAAELQQRLVAFITKEAQRREGGQPTDAERAAVRIKSAEDMIVADEYIRLGGDYRRAIAIYRHALELDPQNAELKAALAKAESNRLLSKDRFALVKVGMTTDEVSNLLGPVNLRNIRQYPDQDVIVWFYPVNDRGAAAGVWFNRESSAEHTVYQTKYDAIE